MAILVIVHRRRRERKGKNLMPSGKSNDWIVMDINKLSRSLFYDSREPLAVRYKGINPNCGYRLDIVVEDKIIFLKLPSASFASAVNCPDWVLMR